MEFVKIGTKELDDFLLSEAGSEFLQSSAWGKIQETEGHDVFYFGVKSDEKIIAVVSMAAKRIFNFINYIYSSRGPIIRADLTDIENIYDCLIKGIKNNFPLSVFYRIEPRKNDLLKIGLAVEKTIDIQPKKTIILDIARSEDEILASMHPKTRYNIRLAQKKDVKIASGQKEEIKNFYELLKETSARDKFNLHPLKHYVNIIENGGDHIEMLLAKKQGKIIAGIMISFFGDTAVYMHGASSNEHRNTMSTYLLQWEAIKLAKERGCKYYDLYGIDEKKWPGVTRFKLGFGGEVKEYPGTYDIVFDEIKYKLYKVSRKVRRIL